MDLWCTARVILGMRYTVSLAKLGDLDLAFAVFDDMISLFERIMAIPNEDEFDMTCNSPALKGFALKSKFHWLIDKDGREYRQLCMHSNDGWENWIIPIHYLESTTDDWFTPLRNDPRWDSCIKRLQACVITREKQN